MSRVAPGELLFESTTTGERSTRLEQVVAASSRIDPETLAARVAFLTLPVPGPTTWSDVRTVGTLRGDADDEELEAAPRSEDDAVAYVRRALTATVERAFAGQRRVGVLTGGGVDSSALLALAVEWAKRDRGRSAFGIAIEFGGQGDDRPHLAALERHLGCEIVRARPEDAKARFRLFLEGVDASPFTWPGGPFEVEALARGRELGADVCAMGAGADELFDGVPQSLADVASSGRLLEAFRRARRMRAFALRPRVPELGWVLRPLAARYAPRRLRAWYQTRRRAAQEEWAGPRLRAAIDASRQEDVAQAVVRRRTAEDRFDGWRSYRGEEPIAWLRHQEQLAAGIARRDPYDDPMLARAITRLPPSWLLRGDIRRGLFREAVRELVPESLRRREDKAYFEEGFTRFVEAVGGFSVLRPFANATRLADLGIVEPAKLKVAFEELAANPIDSWGWGTVWPALAVEAFLRSTEERRWTT